jgi:hypothetical protein
VVSQAPRAKMQKSASECLMSNFHFKLCKTPSLT